MPPNDENEGPQMSDAPSQPRPELRPRVAVVGASANRLKFGNKAVRAFRDAGFDVYPIHPNAERVEGLTAYPSLDALPIDELDRVSFYVPPAVGLGLLDQVARKRVHELWLNPGAGSPELVARAEAMGLTVVEACSILAVGDDPDRL
jgi:predicted CoA-binding protein